MTPCIRIKRGNAYQAVYAILTLQVSVGKISDELEGTGLDTCHFPVHPIDLTYFVAFLFAPHDIHAHQHFSPVTAFGTTKSEEHTSELQSLMRISYAVFCLKKKTNQY